MTALRKTPFEQNEVFIARGQPLPSFMPVLKNNNTGGKCPIGFQSGDCPTGEARQTVAAAGALEASKWPAGHPRQKLFALQAACGTLPEANFPLQHTFAPGVYARTIHLPKGSVIVGKIHKHSHLNILSIGCVRVFTENGGEELLEGPLTMVSAPGTKRAVYALEDTVWTTIHLTASTDLATIESEVIARDYAEYDEFVRSQKAGAV